MRILFVHPNYRSGGAEIAGTWPPAWVAYLSGPLRRAGFDDITFIDAMTENIADEELARRMVELQPDFVGVTAITPDAVVIVSITDRSAGLGTRVSRYEVRSVACSRSRMWVTSAPGRAADTAVASRSPSSCVDEGTDRPPETTTIRGCSIIAASVVLCLVALLLTVHLARTPTPRPTTNPPPPRGPAPCARWQQH